MKLDFDFLDAFAALAALGASPIGRGLVPPKKLSMLLRPAFIARPGKVLVWCDWSAIEARVLPWLANTKASGRVLDIFRTNDADPNLPDIYILTAAELLSLDAAELWAAYKAKGKEAKDARQAYGKVPVLSLGFGGGLGALLAMASNYGVYLDHATATRVVTDWRITNSWAVNFWGKHNKHGSYGLWGAACSALEDPGSIQEIGRVAYVFDKSYLGGTLFCALPNGDLLTYPMARWEWRTVKDKKTKEEEERFQLTFLKGYTRSGLWHGKLAENITQAAAARVLRRTLKRLEYSPELQWMPVVMHTHDEVVVEVDEDREMEARKALHGVMTEIDPWMEGLPLAAEVGSGWAYSKAGD